jgi:hypothetical protein
LARAKQTNRAEARRRHRQTLAQETPEGAEAGDDTGREAPSGAAAGRRPAATAASGRPSLGAAFREAYHAPKYREDLAALPGLLTMRTPSRIPLTRTVIGVPWFIVSAVLVVLGFAGLLIYPAEGTYFLFQLLSLPPGGPTLPVLLVGFTATRASYMLGFLIGVLDLVLIGLYASVVPAAASTTASLGDILTTAAVTGLPTSVLFAASAAWYRRFLTLSSVRRQQAAGASRGRGGGRSSGRR